VAIETLIQDLRFGLRMLRKSPGFTAVVVLTLALGIGANTSIYTLINNVLLNRLPVGHPEQLVLLHWTSQTKDSDIWTGLTAYRGCDMAGTRSGDFNCSFSYPIFEAFRSRSRSFSGIAAYAGADTALLETNGHSIRATGLFVTGDFFSVLEVRPSFGRSLTPADDSSGREPVAVLDFNFWRREFGADPSVVGRTVVFDETLVQIVGVAPPEFFGIETGFRPDFWTPLHAKARFFKGSMPWLDSRKIWLYLIGRLKPGVSTEQARTELEVLFHGSLDSDASEIKAGQIPQGPAESLGSNLGIALTSAERGLASMRDRYSTRLTVLMAIAGFVLLIACLNIANLLLARAASRRKEVAVRLAVGASRGRLFQQFLTESFFLASIGCAAGLLVSFWVSRGVVLLAISESATPGQLTISHPDWRVFGFAVAVAILAAVSFGLVPALNAIRVSPGATLISASGMPGGGWTSRNRNTLGRALSAAEMAFALVLVIGAGLFVRTFIIVETVDPGFATDHLLTFTVAPTYLKIPDDKGFAIAQELQRRFAALPGVDGATWSRFQLLIGNLSSTKIKLLERPDWPESGVQQFGIGPNFFETMKIPILSGRTTAQNDWPKEPAVVWVNQSFATNCLNGVNPLGLHIRFNNETAEIVGVVGDTLYQSVESEAGPTFYWPMIHGDFSFDVRTRGNPQSLEPAIRKTVADVVPGLPVPSVQTLRYRIDSWLSPRRGMAQLTSGLGILALLIAAIGIYGVLAYSIARRTYEIAIRISLGALPADIFRLVLKEGLLPAMFGTIVGLFGSWGLTRFVQQFLFGVKPLDAITFAIATFVLLIVATGACWIPSRRATLVDPMVALRHE
jgi:predicted permease